ncbi:uncharacterized protein PADG_04323 [Paracoccidioides brasiliensis Pb18]|uniref:DNA-directed RNA polymerase subunit n=1 Tax=Paracoccidioides brasiliensis (strain Pb18) TaxID=502780 RepID=C1GAN7_PARBD|nr:uncharacterized protein PADG_04323 [Paracoccidioides brasiliensis Pb18]EEH48239.1 hypothetical protein PADG_04323 [Paracoccidioides brasiliensis Pb18]
MSMDAMDIDSVPLSPERKRKNKENDGHSSKKRKHEATTFAQTAVDEISPKAKKKERKHKNNKDHVYLEESAQTLSDMPNARSKKTKKHKHHAQQTADNDDYEKEEDQRSPQSPTATKKPLTKVSTSQLESISVDPTASSPFYLITATLYVPLYPISISPTHALSSLQAEHLAPLLLTYYHPFRGIVLAYSNASISSIPPSFPSSKAGSAATHNPDEELNPQPLTLATSAGEYGVLFVYLTATFLVFRPERGQQLEGWINVQSDGFLGAVVYNLFSVGIERRRLPADWQWVAPGEGSTATPKSNNTSNSAAVTDDDDDEDSDFDSDKENFRPLPTRSLASVLDLSTHSQYNHTHNDPIQLSANPDEAATAGFFRTRSGRRVRGMIRFRVRDVDVIPGAEADKGFLSIEGTMLSAKEEAQLVEEERKRAGLTPLSAAATMAGGLGEGSTVAGEADGEAPGEVQKGKEKKKKSKKAAS